MPLAEKTKTKKFSLDKKELEVYLKYANMNLPRHTSYPAVPFWKNDVCEKELSSTLKIAAKSQNDFSLYLHIPYCRSLCYYCGCNKEIYPDEKLAKKDPRESFLENLLIEAESYKKDFAKRKLKQVHLGGGTPTFLSPEQLERLMSSIFKIFSLAENPEISIEVDPRVTSEAHLKSLRGFGFNRISLGVQDFDFKVQKAINRIQPFTQVKSLLEKCKALGFSVNFDLIYGLPYQTLESMRKTLDQVLELSPDRIAFYRLAMIPHMFKWQKSFQRCDLPVEDELLAINLMALNSFTENNYEFIGLDHFAKKDDSLCHALESKTLRRNFQGMTIYRDIEILGLGPSAISQLSSAYFQKTKDDKTWRKKIEQNEKSFERFYTFTEDDILRKRLIDNTLKNEEIDASNSR